MSSHSFSKINQKEYLKKYLSGDKKKKKDKKHKKTSADSVNKVKIIDDDINHLNSGPEIDEELLLTGDDAPQIVGEYIEENLSYTKIPKWKSIVIKDEHDDDDIKQNESRSWGRKTDDVKIKQEFTKDKIRSKRITDQSPPRRKNINRGCSSPPRSSRKSTPPAKSNEVCKSPTKCRTNKQSTDRIKNIKEEPQSPPYRQNGRHDLSPPRKRNSNKSPPRRGKTSPPTRNKSTYNRSRHESPARQRNNSDQSPTRKNRSPSNHSRYESSARERKHTDQSPSRKRIKSPDRSPPRCRRRISDQSPPRSHKNDSNDLQPRTNKHRMNTLDNSPPRKSLDQSPPRKGRNLDEPSLRKNKSSPLHHRRHLPDQSPHRRRRSPSPKHKKPEKRTQNLSPQPRHSRWEKQQSERALSPPPTHKRKAGRTLEGKKSGLQDAKSLQKESMERRKQEEILFEKMSSDISGRNAEVQVRSTGRRGRRARAADEDNPEERRRKEEHEEKKKILYDRWGKGLKQIEDHKNRMLEQEYESSKPLARYSNDEDLEKHLKEQERAEDPMLEYMRKKRKEKEKESGKPQMPRYEGPYPENRFGIRPGYRWDGVDRSNGFEKKYFAVQNEKVARRDEAYKYSVEDM